MCGDNEQNCRARRYVRYRVTELFVSERDYKGTPLGDNVGGPPEKVNDWRNYVPRELQKLWGGLSDETKMCVALTAQMQAGAEVWD